MPQLDLDALLCGTDHRGQPASAAQRLRGPDRDELPVLVRWFEGLEPPVAAYLIVILYDREQLAKEGTDIDTEWGVVGCLYSAGRRKFRWRRSR